LLLTGPASPPRARESTRVLIGTLHDACAFHPARVLTLNGVAKATAQRAFRRAPNDPTFLRTSTAALWQQATWSPLGQIRLLCASPQSSGRSSPLSHSPFTPAHKPQCVPIFSPIPHSPTLAIPCKCTLSLTHTQPLRPLWRAHSVPAPCHAQPASAQQSWARFGRALRNGGKRNWGWGRGWCLFLRFAPGLAYHSFTLKTCGRLGVARHLPPPSLFFSPAITRSHTRMAHARPVLRRQAHT